MLFKCLLWCICGLGFSQLSYAYELAIAAMFRNEAPYLKEWVEYHRLVGVDHFWLYNDTSTDNWEDVLAPYVQEGIVDVIDWSNRHAPGTDWVGTQIDAYRDAFQKARGNTTWVAPIDIDEFLIPMKEKNIKKCLRLHFSDASAIYVNWLNFGTSHATIPKGQPLVFRLTECARSTHSDNGIGKSILRPECVILNDMYYPHHFHLLPGFNYVNGEGQPMKYEHPILSTDGKHYDRFLRINHYVLRDEDSFKNKRLARADTSQRAVLLEHYQSFSLAKDERIMQLILRHRSAYERVWKPYL